MAHAIQPNPTRAWRWLDPHQPAFYVLGFILVLAGIALAFSFKTLDLQDARIRSALAGGCMAALATALGTLPVLVSRQFSQRSYDCMLGFGAGMMLAACSFSLIVPALSAAKAQGAGAWAAGGIAGASIVLGAVALMVLDRRLPQQLIASKRLFTQGVDLKRIWLFVLAICLHNMPEGLAIGVACAGTDPQSAMALSAGIAIQDIPEGMVVALALRGAGYGRGFSVGLGAASGLVEPVMALLGTVLVGISRDFLPWGLGAAAGAMLYVICHNIIPEFQRKGSEAFATVALIVGFVAMMVLDTAAS